MGEMVLGALFALPNPKAAPNTYGDLLQRGVLTGREVLSTRKAYEAGLWLYQVLAVK